MLKRDERPLGAVAPAIHVVLVVALLVQLALAGARSGPEVRVHDLPLPPPATVLEVSALGETHLLARVVMLWLQAFDYQPGVSVSFHDLDYARLEQWLERTVSLDAAFSYPFLAAIRLYAEVADADKQRQMIRFVARHFAADRLRRWQWMAHAVYVAKHRLGDHDLALSLARDLARTPASPAVPEWARQMHIFVLEDMGELESAKVLLGGLLESGEITDPHEQWFLSQRLAELEARIEAAAAYGAEP